MLKKILSVALSAFLIFAVPVSLSSCGSHKSSTSMTAKQKSDAEYAKKLHDSIPEVYGK